MTQVSIKNMVCPRCIASVEDVIEQLGLGPATVEIGNAKFENDLNEGQIGRLDRMLQSRGFELLRNETDALVERIKTTVIYLARRDECESTKLSEALPAALNVPYRQLSSLFTTREHRTIEGFFIAQKVEHVKELLGYRQLSVSEIAYRTGYSSVAHLSRQFKQITGITPSQFRGCP